jgi:hypothetical protein
MSSRYLVLESDPSDDGVRWTVDAALTASLGDLGFEYRFRQPGEETLYRDVWEAAGTRAIVSLVADLETPVHYVMVEGESDDLIGRIASALAAALPAVALETLQERAARVDEDPASLVRLALGADAFAPDQRTVELIAAGFEHEQPLVRYRAAEAAALAPSASLLQRLDALAREDPNESVRGMAAHAAQAHRPA